MSTACGTLRAVFSIVGDDGAFCNRSFLSFGPICVQDTEMISFYLMNFDVGRFSGRL